jgi:hypothetical protein
VNPRAGLDAVEKRNIFSPPPGIENLNPDYPVLNIQDFSWKTSREDHLVDLGTDERIILKYILNRIYQIL